MKEKEFLLIFFLRQIIRFHKKWRKIYITNKRRNNEKKLVQLILHRNKKIPCDIIENISNFL